MPLLLGGGMPMLAALERRTKLRLAHQQSYPTGIVVLRYDVVRQKD